MSTRKTVAVGAIVAALAAPVVAQRDLTNWTLDNPYGRWLVAFPTADSIYMTEDQNAPESGPGWVYSDIVLCPAASFSITLSVEADTDDDFIGFAFCRQDGTHMYLVDWKRTTQAFDWGDPVSFNDDAAERGIKLKKIDGSYTRDGLWGGRDGLGVSTVAGPVDRAWSYHTPYTFEVDLGPGRIVVRLDGETIFNVAETSFAGGAIATYGFTQDELLFRGVFVEISTCTADFTGDCILNVFDFLAYQTAFGNEDPAADLAIPFGILNVFDFLAFQTAFGNGC